jgi:hypothetical protein
MSDDLEELKQKMMDTFKKLQDKGLTRLGSMAKIGSILTILNTLKYDYTYFLFIEFLKPDNFNDQEHFNELLDDLNSELTASTQSERDVINILKEYIEKTKDTEYGFQEIQVRNHQGQLETRRIRVPRDEQINVIANDFNRNKPNPNPPKIFPFNFKRNWNFDGECVICMENTPQSWCRVNCPAGHVFHCACIKEYTNTLRNTGVTGYFYEEGNFNKQCPLCGLEFTQLSELPDPKSLINRFGKKKLLAELRYLLRLK